MSSTPHRFSAGALFCVGFMALGGVAACDSPIVGKLRPEGRSSPVPESQAEDSPSRGAAFAASAAPLDPCVASDLDTWLSCRDRMQAGGVAAISVVADITCPAGVGCGLTMVGADGLYVGSERGAVFRRGGDFDRPLLTFRGVRGLTVRGLTIEDPPNAPVQDASRLQEVNALCAGLSSSFGPDLCEPTVVITDSERVALDHVRILNGKLFGLTLSGNQSAVLTGSEISGAFMFGVWGAGNRSLLIADNTFRLNRSNAVLMDFGRSEDTRIVGNHFFRNHHATAFHVCGASRTEPCPGGQIDLTAGVQNITIEGNTFEAGGMSGEFPEDLRYDWVAGIEFEPNRSVVNVVIQRNLIKDNSGSPLYLNLPAPDPGPGYSVDVRVRENGLCNNGTPNTLFQDGVPWGSGVVLEDNCGCDVPCAHPSPAPEHRVVGFVDWVDESGHLVGWLADQGAPEVALSFELDIDGRAALSGLAGLPRADVNSALSIPGDHGFYVTIPDVYRDGVLHTLSVVGVDAAGTSSAPLPGAVTSFLLRPPVAVPVPRIEGAGTGCDDNYCLWLLGDGFDPDAQVTISSSATGASLATYPLPGTALNVTSTLITLALQPGSPEYTEVVAPGIRVQVVNPASGASSNVVSIQRP